MTLLSSNGVARLGHVGFSLALSAPMLLLMGCGETDPDRVYDRALAAVETSRIDDAESELRRLGELRPPTILDRGLRARVAIARNRNDEAIELLRSIPDDHALASWARLREGQLLVRLHRFPAAEAALLATLAIDPALVEPRRELIYIYGLQLRRRDLDRTFREVSARSRLSPKEVWVWCMVRDLAWWSPGEHAPLLEAAIAADPGDRASILALAEVERRQGYYDAAEALLARNPSDDAATIAALAEIDLERTGPDAARARLDAAPRPDDPDFDGLRGRIALADRRADDAVRLLTRALEHDPGRRGAIADLGKALILAGQPDRGRPYVESAARIDRLDNLLLQAENRISTRDPALFRSLAEACEAADRLPEARAWYNILLEIDPTAHSVQSALFRLDRRLAPADKTP
jgi:predicted Zn-dependent protease